MGGVNLNYSTTVHVINKQREIVSGKTGYELFWPGFCHNKINFNNFNV